MAEQTSRPRAQRLFDVLGAALAAMLAFTAIPVVLILVIGNPLSGGLGHAWRPLPRDTLCVLALTTWVAWAACCAQLARAVIARVRSGDVRSGVTSSVLDRVAIRIASGVLAVTSMGAPIALASSAGASAPPATVTTAPARPTRSPAGSRVPAVPTRPPGGEPPPAAQGALHVRADGYREALTLPTHLVRHGDTLWRVAEERLDDGAAWTEVAALNVGRAMSGGARFVDPDHLETSWQLRLPARARPHPRLAEDRRGSSVARGATGATSHAEGEGGRGRLPELVALGLGSLTCAALARRARRGRRGEPFTSALNVPALSEQAVDAATLLGRFEGLPALEAFEAANARLQRALDGGPPGPRVRAICVSPRGVTFWLVHPRAEAPDGFAVVLDGEAWHVEHDTLDDETPGGDPYLPVALPVGTDHEGTWLVCVEPGEVLPVLGEAAPALCRSARAAVGAWAWSDSVFATDRPDDPALQSVRPSDAMTDRRLVFFGDPAALPPGVAAHTAVVTTASVASCGLTVLVDRHGATLHPMGRVLRPYLQGEDMSLAIGELAAHNEKPTNWAPEREPPTESPARVPFRDLGHDGGFDRVHRVSATPGGILGEPDVSEWTPGPVEVRLLTASPRLEGLSQEIPPNRARRVVELVAYLALHCPDLVTSDRLRTRVLGSADTDATSKTLFNVAYAARRAMGTDDRGLPLFPAATRNGHYQVSERVTVDVLRAAALVTSAQTQRDPDTAVALFRAALELVEGEPLANALSGYSWWEAEGHGARIAAILVDAACSMADLAAEAGHVKLARWGLEQARIVEPYSEALSRAAMQLAAREGDVDRLRLEWRDCQRRVDALDPGSSPSLRTESLYGELSRLVSAGSAGARRRPTYVPAGAEGATSGS